jgi:hypothetical protein
VIDAALAAGLVAAFRGRMPRGDSRLAIALLSLIVAALYDWYVFWVASTNATQFAVALVFALPLLCLGTGVGSAVRACLSVHPSAPGVPSFRPPAALPARGEHLVDQAAAHRSDALG